MPHVSRRKLKTQTQVELLHALSIVFSKISKTDEMSSFLLSLMSETERLMLAKRVSIVVLLKEEIPESAVADALNVTRETVSRIRYAYELRGDGYELALKKLEEEKLLGEFKKLLISLAKYSVRAAGGRIKV